MAGAHPVVVTLSAPYGAGGSVIGPRLAEELGVAFVDRAIPAAVAERLALSEDEAAARDECAPSTLDRLLRSFGALGPVFTGAPPVEQADDRTFAQATEEVLRERAREGGVLLGRAGAVVLRDVPGALHVRLTGPVEARIAQAMTIEGVDRAAAERRLRQTDDAREAYVRHFYAADASDVSLYHLVIDATAIPLGACLRLIADAARARAAS